MPALKAQTNHHAVVKAARLLSDYTKQLNLDFVEEGSCAFDYNVPDHPMQRYARQVHHDIIFTAFHFGITDPEHMLCCHTDKHQPKEPSNHAIIVGLSCGVVVDGVKKRLVALGYGRKSMFEAEERIAIHRGYVDAVCNGFAQLHDARKYLSPSNFESIATDVECIPGFLIKKAPCNLDPNGFTNSEIYMTLQLEKRFQLTLPELTSIFRAKVSLYNYMLQ
jgi:hypothetical protein